MFIRFSNVLLYFELFIIVKIKGGEFCVGSKFYSNLKNCEDFNVNFF